MKFISVKAELDNGVIKVPLDKSCRCLVALAEFYLPSIDTKQSIENNIDVTCEQIDSCFENPTRLLKRLVFNGTKSTQTYNRFTATWFDFKLIDSQDKFLILRIRRTNGQRIRFKHDNEIFLTLAFKPIREGDDKWLRI